MWSLLQHVDEVDQSPPPLNKLGPGKSVKNCEYAINACENASYFNQENMMLYTGIPNSGEKTNRNGRTFNNENISDASSSTVVEGNNYIGATNDFVTTSPSDENVTQQTSSQGIENNFPETVLVANENNDSDSGNDVQYPSVRMSLALALASRIVRSPLQVLFPIGSVASTPRLNSGNDNVCPGTVQSEVSPSSGEVEGGDEHPINHLGLPTHFIALDQSNLGSDSFHLETPRDGGTSSPNSSSFYTPLTNRLSELSGDEILYNPPAPDSAHALVERKLREQMEVGMLELHKELQKELDGVYAEVDRKDAEYHEIQQLMGNKVRSMDAQQQEMKRDIERNTDRIECIHTKLEQTRVKVMFLSGRADKQMAQFNEMNQILQDLNGRVSVENMKQLLDLREHLTDSMS